MKNVITVLLLVYDFKGQYSVFLQLFFLDSAKEKFEEKNRHLV